MPYISSYSQGVLFVIDPCSSDPWSLIRDPLFPRNHSRSLYELIRFRHLYTSCVIFHSETLAAFRFERTLCAVTRYWLSYPEPWWSCSPVASGDETQSMFERRVAASTEAVSLSLQTVFSILTLKKLKCWSFTARGGINKKINWT